MSKETDFSPADIQTDIPPDSAEAYTSHERYLSRTHGWGAMKSIQKEREGMARLYAALEAELDGDSLATVTEIITQEYQRLDQLEDDVVPLEPPPDAKY
jgi:hypothetical protein